MQFLALLMQLLPYIPTVVRAVETIHGGAPSNGAAKLETAISLIQHVEPAIVAHLQNDPNRAKLTGLIGGVVAGINAAQTWKLPVEETSPFPQ